MTTAAVAKGSLSDSVSEVGILTFRARPDGSPFAVVNQAGGTYTAVPEAGDTVGCGDPLYRVDNGPVLLLCGTVPAYRGLRAGDRGADVGQLNRNLRIDGDTFTGKTVAALKRLQAAHGLAATGALARGAAVFLPAPARIAAVAAEPGGAARPGALVMHATTAVPQVQVGLDPSQQRAVQPGDRARITLPDNAAATGRVDRVGRVVTKGAIPASISLDSPAGARGFDQAPVQVDIRTKGVANALNVPVTAIVGAPGGFAVERVNRDGRHEMVAVRLGLFDAGGGRVQVTGDLAPGDRVVVPSL